MPKGDEGSVDLDITGGEDVGDSGGMADLVNEVNFFEPEEGDADYEASEGDADSESEEEEGAEEDAEDGGDDDGQEDVDGETSDEEEEAPKKVKKGHTTIRVKGEEITIPDTTKIDVVIDGESETFSLSELKQAKAGSVSYHNRIREVEQERKQFRKSAERQEQERNQREEVYAKHSSLINTIKPFIEKKNFEGVLNEVLAYFDAPAEEFWNHYDKANETFYSQYSQLSDDQKAVVMERRKLALHSQQLQRKERQQQQAESLKNFNNATSETLKNAGLSRVEVDEAWTELSDLANSGRLNPQTIAHIKGMNDLQRFQYVASYALSRKTDKKVKKVVDTHFPKYSKKYGDLVRKLEDVMPTNKLINATESDIKQILKIFVASNSSNEETSDRKSKLSRKKSTITNTGDKPKKVTSARHKAVRASQESDDEDDYGGSMGRGASGEALWGDSFSNLTKL